MEDLDKDDLIIPKLKIVQPTSEEGTAGTFRLNLGDEFKELRVVFLRFSKGRVMFSKNLKEGALCGSSDRIHPHPFFENPMSDSCASCPYGAWDGRKPSECNESYTLLGVDVETRIPFFFQTRSTAIRPTKLFLSGIAFRAQKLKADMWNFEVTLRLKEVVNDKGKFYVPVFDKLTYLKESPYAEDAELYAKEEAGFEQPGENAGGEDDGPPF